MNYSSGTEVCLITQLTVNIVAGIHVMVTCLTHRDGIEGRGGWGVMGYRGVVKQNV